MARVQLVIPDEDRAKFVQQAKKEGLSLSAWLRTAAREKLEKQQDRRPFESVEELEDFYKRIDARHEAEGLGPEPDWEEHKRVINHTAEECAGRRSEQYAGHRLGYRRLERPSR